MLLIRALTAAIFAPLAYESALISQYVARHSLPPTWTFIPWASAWTADSVLHHFTVWLPPPELARQVLSTVLETWVESPMDTSALFFIPHILQGQWKGLSRHLVELDAVYPFLLPLTQQPLLPIPIVVLSLPCFHRFLPVPSSPSRLVTSASPSDIAWHKQQAAYLRGLPSTCVES